MSLLRLSGQSWQQYQYWREYKGENVQIRNYSAERETEDEHNRRGVQQTSHVVEGEIKKVMSVSPGFLLKNVTEYIYLSDYEMFSAAAEFEYQTYEGQYSRQNIREVDEKFVSFDSIEQLEKVEHAEEAVEPFREKQRQNPEQATQESGSDTR